MSRVTMRTISEATGLSKYAVSRALAGKSGVSEATRARIRKVAEELGYHPSVATQRLRLAVFLEDTHQINGELYVQIQTGVQRAAQKLGHEVAIQWTHDRQELLRETKASHGLLFVGDHDEQALAQTYASGKPVVRIGWIDPLQPVDLVGGTDHEAGSAVALRMIALGHRNIAYVHGDARYRGRMERLYGLRESIEAHPGVKMHDLIWGESGPFAQHLDRLWAADDRPTAFFCAHDGLALTVVTELLARGCAIPRDASVVGFGDYSAAHQIRPSLTTVRVPGQAFGELAVRLLDSRLTDSDFPSVPMRLLIPNELVERASLGPAPG